MWWWSSEVCVRRFLNAYSNDSHFLSACQQLVLAAAVAFWYFRKPTNSPVGTALSKLVKYHLGSAAKGSILILLFKIPRLILTYLYAKWVLFERFVVAVVVVRIYAEIFRLFYLWLIDWRGELMPDRGVQNAVWNHVSAAFGFWRSSFDFWIIMRTPWLVSEYVSLLLFLTYAVFFIFKWTIIKYHLNDDWAFSLKLLSS